MLLSCHRLLRCLLRKGTVLLLILPLLLNGCAGLAPKTTQVHYYPACYAPINKLREENKKFASTVAAGIIIGGLIGAGLGLALGGGRGAGAAIGAVSGMAGGALIGYAMAKQQKIKDDQARRASISTDIDGDINSMDGIALASIQARQCYTAQFDMELARYKAGQLSKAEFLERAKEIISGLNEIAALLKSSGSGAEQRLLQYKAAVDAEYKKAGQQAPPLTAETLVQPAPTPAPEPEPAPRPKRKHRTKKTASKPAAPVETPKPATAGAGTMATAQGTTPAASPSVPTAAWQPATPLPDANSLEGGAKRCDVMVTLRDKLKTESDLAGAKASDCQNVVQEISLEMKTEWLPGSGIVSSLAPRSVEGATCPRPRG